jgi:hypothetical protein
VIDHKGRGELLLLMEEGRMVMRVNEGVVGDEK